MQILEIALSSMRHIIARLIQPNKDWVQDWPWLGPVIVVGLVLRLWGIGFGLPGLYHPDEGLIVRQALAFGAGILRPYSYVYSPLLPYMLTVLYGLYFVFGLLTGRFHSPADLAVLFFNAPTPFYLLARLISAFFGVASILMAYVLSVRAYGRRAGIAALFVAFSPALIRQAHYALCDVPAACLVLIALYALWRFTQEPTMRRWVVAGVAAGLAIVMKYYTTWSLACALLAAVAWVAKKEHWPMRRFFGYAVWGTIVSVGTFLVISPYTVLDFRNFWADVVLFQLGTQVGYGLEFSKMLFYYANALSSEGLGLPLLIAAVGGLAYTMYRRRSVDVLLASFVLPYVIVLLFQGRYQLNWTVTLLPALSILSALALDKIWLVVIAPKRHYWPVALLLLAVMVWPMACCAYQTSQEFSWPDTRSLAREWIESNIPPGAKILSDPLWAVPQLRQNHESLVRYLDERANAKGIEYRSDSTQMAYGQYARYQLAALDRYTGPTYDIVYIQHEWWKSDEQAPDIGVYPVWGLFEGRVLSLEELWAQGFQYAVVSSLKYRQYLSEEGRKKWPSYYRFYSSLEEECQLVKVFEPGVGITGPVIKLYDLRGKP
ncbi:MAG: ArnT family glycosyltransferase [Anaerolineae bacterium]